MTEALTFEITARAVGAALLHSLWQGAVAAGAAAVALGLLRGASAHIRYAAVCVALAGTLAAWMVTAITSAAPLVTAQGSPPPIAGTAPLLGAGPFDFSSPIQPLSAPDGLAAGTWPSLWARLDGWSQAAVPLWFAGVLLLSVRLGVSWAIVARLRRVALCPASSELAARVVRLARRVGVSRTVQVAQSAAVRVPAVAGWLRPIILLPASALAGLTPAQLDAIVAHELAHVRRHDYAVNLLQAIAETFLFYHPACWWLSHRIRVEREYCCDDVAVSVCGDRLVYASALTELEHLRHQPAVALAAAGGPLLQRIHRLLAAGSVHGTSPGWTAAAAPLGAIVLLLTTVTLVPALAQGAPEQSKTPGVGRTVPGDRGIVQGQVVEAGTGRPIEGARVEVRGTPGAEFVTTDREGRYETRPLAPGAYSVSATAPGHALSFSASRTVSFSADSVSIPGQFTVNAAERLTTTSVNVRAGSLVSNINLTMQASGHLSGRILDDRGRGLAGAYIELLATRATVTGAFPGVAYAQSESDGTYRVTAPPGDYVVRAYIGRHVRPSRDAALAYVTTFYPGVRAQPEAQVLRVDAGLEQYDVDFALVSSRTVRVSGIVVDPVRDSLDQVRVSLRGVPSASGERGVALDLNARGEFETRDVAPGAYLVTVSDPLLPARWNAARRQIEITDDVSGLEIRASTAASVAGRLVRDARSSGKLNLGQVMVGFVLKGHDGPAMTMGTFQTELDGTFSGELPTEPLTLTVGGPPEWRVRSVLVDGVEAFGRPIEVAPGSHEIEVVLTDRFSSVEGLVIDRRGTPLGGFDVVLFPQDEMAWYFASPLIHQTRSRQDGVFELRPLTPGDYLAVATEGIPFLMMGDPATTLRHLRSIGTRLKVGDGERKTISIRASPAPEGLVRFTP